jgi:exonuclease III
MKNKNLDFSLLLTNSNGLNSSGKVNNLLNYSKESQADIIITTETHWKTDEWPKNPRLANRWDIVYSNSGAIHASGGVAIWIKKCKFHLIGHFTSDRIVSVDIRRNSQDYRIIAIYAPTGDKKRNGNVVEKEFRHCQKSTTNKQKGPHWGRFQFHNQHTRFH